MPMPEDPDEYMGVPLSLGPEASNPVRATRGWDVARVLAEAIACASPAVRQSIMDRLGRRARSGPADGQACAAGIALEMIDEFLDPSRCNRASSA